MGLLKWLCKRFSCNSNCKYNEQMAECHKTSVDNVNNIMNYELSIKDILKINKILNKKELKEVTYDFPRQQSALI